MPEPYATVIADSISEEGHRITTVEAGCWRPVLAEQNTHCVLARNSASSRAIPVEKMLDRFINDPMYPAEWRSEKPGMQGGAELEGDDLTQARYVWDDIMGAIYGRIERYTRQRPDKSTRLHKSLLNRWLEPGLQQVQIITATQWDGYFWQRCHEAADPNIRLMAQAIKDAMDASTPKPLQPGEWHLPYFGEKNGGHPNDWPDAHQMVELGESAYPIAKKVSAGRCARVSYLNQSGVRDLEDDLTLFTRLADREHDLWEGDPPHASPLEHIATPWPGTAYMATLPDGRQMGPLPYLGKMVGWRQFRHEELLF